MPRAGEVIEQRGDHLLEPHRNGAATDADRQRFILQIGNVAGIGALRRKSGNEHILQTSKMSSVILEASKRRIASKETM